MVPSAAPSRNIAAAPPTNASTKSSVDPAVIAAIVGGSMTLLAACCCSMYLCLAGGRRRKQEDEEDERTPMNPASRSQTQSRKRLPSSKSSSQDPSTSFAIAIPDIVQLDDDHQSLANTTLGECTAGRKPPKKKRLVDADVTTNTSFEEESLYTMGIARRIQPSKLIDDDDDDDQSSGILPPPELRGVNMENDDGVFFPDGNDSSDGDSPFKAPRTSPMVPQFATLAEEPVEHRDAPDSLVAYGFENSDEDEEAPHSCSGTGDQASLDRYSFENDASMQHLSRSSTRSTSSTPQVANTADLAALSLEGSRLEDDDVLSHDAPGDYSSSGSVTLLHRKEVDTIAILPEQREDTSMSPSQLLENEDSLTNVSPIDLGDFDAREKREGTPRELLEEEDKQTKVSPIELEDTAEGAMTTPLVSPRQSPYPWNPPKSMMSTTPGDDSQGSRQLSISPYRTRYLQNMATPKSRNSSPGSKASPSNFHTPMSDASAISASRSPDNPADAPTEQNGIKLPSFPVVGDTTSAGSSSSGASSGGDNPWLFETVADTLGPRSASADMESLGGRSNRSAKSYRSQRSNRSGKSGKSRGSRHSRRRHRSGSSVGSRGSRNSNYSYGSAIDQRSASEISLAPRSLENDLQRLEMQLACLKKTDSETPVTGSIGGTSASMMSGLSHSTRQSKSSKRQRVIVVVPPGKLGVILANRHDGRGTVVSEVRPTSVLKGALVPGDRLVAIDGEAVGEMMVSEITEIMSSKSDKPRHLTVITSTKIRSLAHDTPHKNDLVSTSGSGSP